jgi:hypothetical protein
MRDSFNIPNKKAEAWRKIMKLKNSVWEQCSWIIGYGKEFSIW